MLERGDGRKNSTAPASEVAIDAAGSEPSRCDDEEEGPRLEGGIHAGDSNV